MGPKLIKDTPGTTYKNDDIQVQHQMQCETQCNIELNHQEINEVLPVSTVAKNESILSTTIANLDLLSANIVPNSTTNSKMLHCTSKASQPTAKSTPRLDQIQKIFSQCTNLLKSTRSVKSEPKTYDNNSNNNSDLESKEPSFVSENRHFNSETTSTLESSTFKPTAKESDLMKDCSNESIQRYYQERNRKIAETQINSNSLIGLLHKSVDNLRQKFDDKTQTVKMGKDMATSQNNMRNVSVDTITSEEFKRLNKATGLVPVEHLKGTNKPNVSIKGSTTKENAKTSKQDIESLVLDVVNAIEEQRCLVKNTSSNADTTKQCVKNQSTSSAQLSSQQLQEFANKTENINMSSTALESMNSTNIAYNTVKSDDCTCYANDNNIASTSNIGSTYVVPPVDCTYMNTTLKSTSSTSAHLQNGFDILKKSKNDLCLQKPVSSTTSEIQPPSTATLVVPCNTMDVPSNMPVAHSFNLTDFSSTLFADQAACSAVCGGTTLPQTPLELLMQEEVIPANILQMKQSDLVEKLKYMSEKLDENLNEYSSSTDISLISNIRCVFDTLFSSKSVYASE